MRARPVVFLDPHWRQVSELFSEADLARLRGMAELRWARDDKAGPVDLSDVDVLIQTEPRVTSDVLDAAPHLSAVIEVSGAFPASIDYAACAARGVEVLSCAPGFREAVAEMALGMLIAGARGLVAEHEAFRQGLEGWLADREGRDWTLFGAEIGFVGYGSIAREIHRLLTPFGVRVRAHDPWVGEAEGVTFGPLDEVLERSQAVLVCAAPTTENRGLIGRAEIAQMRDRALLAVISRAHLVDFETCVEAAMAGRIAFATDVFPEEPLPAGHPIRQAPNVILSPHRAAAVPGGRQPIGRMIVDDIALMIAGEPPRHLQRAAGRDLAALTGVSDAASVGAMAEKR